VIENDQRGGAILFRFPWWQKKQQEEKKAERPPSPPLSDISSSGIVVELPPTVAPMKPMEEQLQQIPELEKKEKQEEMSITKEKEEEESAVVAEIMEEESAAATTVELPEDTFGSIVQDIQDVKEKTGMIAKQFDREQDDLLNLARQLEAALDELESGGTRASIIQDAIEDVFVEQCVTEFEDKKTVTAVGDVVDDDSAMLYCQDRAFRRAYEMLDLQYESTWTRDVRMAWEMASPDLKKIDLTAADLKRIESAAAVGDMDEAMSLRKWQIRAAAAIAVGDDVEPNQGNIEVTPANIVANFLRLLSNLINFLKKRINKQSWD